MSYNINETFIIEPGENGGGTSLTGGTFNNQTLRLFNSDNTVVVITGFTDTFVTGGTYSAGTLTLTNNSGNTFTVTGFSTSNATQFTGGTVTGSTIFTGGLTANTISATTYQNLPLDISVTGGTSIADGFILTNNDNTQINVTGLSTSILYNTTLSPSLASNGVGGISGGTTVAQLSGKTLINILDNLIFPTVNPTFTSPSYSINDGLSSLLEITSGITTFPVTITGTFNRGTILLNGQTQDFRAGTATTYTFIGQSIPTLVTQAGNTYSLTLTAQTGLMSYISTVNYVQGPQPYDNKGNPYSTPYPAGSLSANHSFEGVYPLYATIYNGNLSAISGYTKFSSLISMINPPSVAPTSLTSLGNGISVNFASELDGGGNPLGFRQTLLVPTGITKTLHIWLWGGQSWGDEVGNWLLSSPFLHNGINYKKYTYNSQTRGATSPTGSGSPLMYLTWT